MLEYYEFITQYAMDALADMLVFLKNTYGKKNSCTTPLR